jgi:vanillate O-demethylase monooxygenase subunit
VPDGLKLKVLRELRGAPPPPIYGVPMGLTGRIVDRFTDANFVSPGAHLAYAKIAVPDPRDGERDLYRVNLLHAITPENQDSLHYWWFLARDFAHGDQAASDYLTATTNKAFNEDVEALTLIAAQHRDGEDWRELSFPADKPGLAMRKNLMAMVRAEAAA